MRQFVYANNVLTASVSGNYVTTQPLANVTIAGLPSRPTGCNFGQAQGNVHLNYADGVLRISGLEGYTTDGAWTWSRRIELVGC